MYVITNREILEGESGLEQFGKRPNRQGPNELRLARVTRRGRGWQVEFLADKLERAEVRELVDEFRLPIDPAADWYASLKVACDLARTARANKSHLLFFVHGYNNDMEDVLDRAHDLEKRYGVEVVPFSWPADGGGIVGTASYKADKRDARASAGALERAVQKLHDYLRLITEATREDLRRECEAAHPDNREARDALFARLLEKRCPFTVNALFHSMGNYLFKQTFKSSLSESRVLAFDNVVLCAADTNNFEHELWVDQIRFRKRCFVTINEDDHALSASRAKSGSEQLARLGHYLRNLNARQAHYVNFTHASWVRNSHAYFGDPAEKNDRVQGFFRRAFRGECAEEDLRFRPEGNWYGFD